ncbi:MAG: hypothetical protein ACK4S4_01085 [Pyrinomonadaceae bacterium]
MNKKLFSLVVAVYSLVLLPVQLNAGTYTYTPPPKRGIIYIVVQFKPYSSRDQLRMDENTNVSVRWGSYSNSKSYGRGRMTLRLKVGFIITLKHTKDDSIPMTVESEGQIELVRQLDSPPPQWNDSKYDKYNW